MALVSAIFIISSIIVVLLNIKMKNDIIIEKDRNVDAHKDGVVFSNITSGYAYTVDVGDSMVIVVVVDKNNIYKNFTEVRPLPITVHGVGEIE